MFENTEVTNVRVGNDRSINRNGVSLYRGAYEGDNSRNEVPVGVFERSGSKTVKQLVNKDGKMRTNSSVKVVLR